MSKLISKVLINLIRFYQSFISPLKLRRSCRFHPTCSEYTVRALIKYGVLKGGIKAVGRIFKCHPFNSGGYDPVD
ncbi:membrane protein insertion efficiency factor YidD [Natroniella acetigena]|uniref:membrane protein insertion efficiency factor YidD n=1 Tax=Natroniella acetigena TaxID=52004 RepID=UPI00200B85B7|nr:membrane protein insertion efficiency factor YidD [Natroniella acetigena]MCK8826838.1 membrane protein insertion efficiency factor YidD [Natroniella acetigena]